MTAKQLTILTLLSEHGPSIGLDLVKRSRGKLKRGTVYVDLQALIDADMVTAEDVTDSGDPPRRVFTITMRGLLTVARDGSAYDAAVASAGLRELVRSGNYRLVDTP